MKRPFFKIYLLLITPLLWIPASTYGQSDLFEIRTPNVMIIFDTSSSMNLDVNGNPVPSGIAIGVDGISRNYQGGGDHPNSKLFLAKKALREVIKDLENVNLGFATYGQRKQEKWRGYFKKCKPAQAEKNWCEKRYWRWRKITLNSDPRTANDFSPNSFKDAWGKTWSGVTVGFEFDREISLYDKPASPIPPHSNLKTKTFTWKYRVTSIKFNPEYGWYTYTYNLSNPVTYDTYEETIRSIDPCGSCGPDKVGDPFPEKWLPSGVYHPDTNPYWETYFKDDSRDAAFKDEYDKPFGNNPARRNWWNCNPKNQPAKPECWDYDYTWRTYTGTKSSVCDSAKDQSDGWRFESNCFDFSEYYYPLGPSPALPLHPDRPHTWSYFRIGTKSGVGEVWKDNQPNPYYPAPTADPGSQDNNFFFLNFPAVDDSQNNYAARNKIISWLDLTPVQNPDTERWHTKLPLKANSITSNTIESLYTPLADSLEQAKKYFSAYIEGDGASKSVCRGNYIILMTDGLESARFKADGITPDYDAAANAAEELFNLVKDSKGLPAGVKTYVIGFGKGLGDKPEVLNDIAKKGGTGKAYFVDNPEALKEAFKTIFQLIGTGYGRSNPVVTGNRDTLYRAYFRMPGWEGQLMAYSLNPDGSLTDKDKDGKIDENDAKWDAGQVMNSSGRGKIYTWVDEGFEPKRIDFTVGNVEKIKDKDNYLLNTAPEEDINLDGKKDKVDSETVISFVLDPGFDGGKYKGSRSPTWKLGDIYHSTPLVVGKPPFNIPDDQFPKKYSDFKTAQKNRPTMIYVGANDGMLHAFDDKDGKEKFAIIPRNLLGKLRELRKEHQFYVDSSPRAYDVFFYKGKKKGNWATVLISGQRGGGKFYFAIDITDPNDPQILWDLTHSRMGYTWSRPEIGRVKIGGVEKFVAFVGGGYTDPNESKNDNIGNTFYIIDIEGEDNDKRILRTFEVGNKSNRIPAGATVFDKDMDGRIDGVYFGDIQGTLWKIKIDGEEDVSKWKLVELFKSDGGNPIFYPPAVTKNNQGRILVYFGQGNELDIFEKDKDHYFYEIWDKGDSGQILWKKSLKKGEKVLASPSIANNVVYFTTWEYTGVEDNCGAGVGRLYGLTISKAGHQGGEAALFYDLTGESLKKPSPFLTLGKGIPSAPVVTNGVIYISSSLNANYITTIKIPTWGKGKLKSWREVF